MLRITVHDNPRFVTFQLEGSLAGPWLQELEQCWQSTLARQHKAVLCVDLTGVTSISTAGKAFLASLHRQGAKFVAADCVTKAVVEDITQAPRSCGRECEVPTRKPPNEIELQHDDQHLGPAVHDS